MSRRPAGMLCRAHANETRPRNKGGSSMKLTLGVLAGLWFASTIAVGQYGGGSPFPQAANPALRNGEHLLPVISPSSMAANSPSVLSSHQKVDTGSPFPQAANPSLGSGTSGQT